MGAFWCQRPMCRWLSLSMPAMELSDVENLDYRRRTGASRDDARQHFEVTMRSSTLAK